MNKDEVRVAFLKNRILSRLDEMQEYMSSTKYKLYKTMINDCDSFDEIREVAELDMQFGLINYIKELKSKLSDSNVTIQDIEAINNSNAKAVKMAVIKPQKVVQSPTKVDDIDLSTLGEDIEDEEVLASAANILLSRINNIPPEELYREQLEDYEEEDELTADNVDELDISEDDFFDTSMEEEEEDEEDEFDIEEDEDFFGDDDEDDDELDIEDIDEDELGLEDEEEKQDIKNIVPDFSNQSEDEDDELDFGDNNTSDDSDETDWDTLGDDMFEEDTDEEFGDDDDETDWDSLGDDMFIDEDEDEPDDEEDEETDWDTLGDDMFVDEEDEEPDEDEEDTDWDTLGDDMFDDNTDDGFFDDDEDSLDDDGSSIDDLDNIDADDLFGDDEDDESDDEDDESDDEDDDPFSELDKLDDDDFDLDDTDFEYDEPDEDAESFDDFFRAKDVNEVKKANKREITSQAVFINGSKRGQQTQDMFNMLNGMFGGFGKAGLKIGNTFKKTVKTGVKKVNNSSFFNLPQ